MNKDMNKEKKIWLVTDTHFNHKNIMEYEERPENYQDLIKKNWNNLIGEDDLVIHLGDVIFSNPSELSSILEDLNGNKVLVRGNHDKKNVGWYMGKGFSFVCDLFCVEIFGKEIMFSHEPVKTNSINIHGHFHSNPERHKYEFYGENHICISMEETAYKPILLKKLLENT